MKTQREVRKALLAEIARLKAEIERLNGNKRKCATCKWLRVWSQDKMMCKVDCYPILDAENYSCDGYQQRKIHENQN